MKTVAEKEEKYTELGFRQSYQTYQDGQTLARF